MAVQPMHIAVPDDVLKDLRQRLGRTRWPLEGPVDDWSMGASPAFLRRLLEYWQDQFDWRSREAELNTLNHVTVDVGDLTIHAIHERASGSADPASAPPSVLLLHGWPDSFLRYRRVVPLLTAHRDVVVPSLPGFGFSSRTALSSGPTADVLVSLMDELGYDRFAVAGGDISTPVVHELTRRHADRLVMAHLTDAGFPNGTEDLASASPAVQTFAAACQRWWYLEGAYNMEQSTKPRTLAVGLTDSPAGLAAWVIEKFHAWSARPGHLEERFSLDELLTNITLYWVTNTISSSTRTYLENTRAMYATGGPQPVERTHVPTAIASFPDEDVPVVREWAERSFDVRRFIELSRGGHFAALEEPELYADDLLSALQELAPQPGAQD